MRFLSFAPQWDQGEDSERRCGKMRKYFQRSTLNDKTRETACDDLPRFLVNDQMEGSCRLGTKEVVVLTLRQNVRSRVDTALTRWGWNLIASKQGV